jgi:hypothetical protein
MPVTSVADQVVWRLAPEDAPAGEPAEQIAVDGRREDDRPCLWAALLCI